MVFEEQEIGLTELIGVFKKHWLLILVPSILAAGLSSVASHIYFSRMPDVYAAHALVRVGGSPAHPLEKTDELMAIMQSPAVRGEIATAVDAQGFSATPEAVGGSLSYANESGLVKINAHAARPELAAAMAHAALTVLVDRHRAAYEAAQKERDDLVKYVKEKAQPLAITFSDIAELRLVPTVIVAPAAAGNTPLPQQRRPVVLPVFAFVAFLMSLISLYLHSVQKNKSVLDKR